MTSNYLKSDLALLLKPHKPNFTIQKKDLRASWSIAQSSTIAQLNKHCSTNNISNWTFKPLHSNWYVDYSFVLTFTVWFIFQVLKVQKYETSINPDVCLTSSERIQLYIRTKQHHHHIVRSFIIIQEGEENGIMSSWILTWILIQPPPPNSSVTLDNLLSFY